MRKKLPYSLVARTIGNSVYIYYRYRRLDGTRSPLISTGVKAESPSAPDIAAAKRKANLICLDLFSDDRLKQSSSMSIAEYTRNFFTDSCRYVQWKRSKGTEQHEGLTKSTIAFYRTKLEQQIIPYIGNLRLCDLTIKKCKSWVLELKRAGYSNKTINGAIGVMRIIRNQAMEDELITVDPLLNIGTFRVDKINKDLWTMNELREMFREERWSNQSARLAAILACCTGMRIGEIIALDASDIHDNYIDVTKNYDRKFGYGDVKTHSSRKIPLSQELRELVLVGPGLLFPGRKTAKTAGHPLGSDAIRSNLRAVMRQMGIDYKKRKLTFHAFRHFFNTYLEKSDINPNKIRAVMGHKDDSMTGLYTDWNANDFPEVFEKQKNLIRSILWQ